MTFCRAIVAVAVLVLSIGLPVAGAVSGPDANQNSKFVYTQEVVSTATNNLLITFEEGSQKRFPSVDYQLDATVDVTQISCDGQGTAQRLSQHHTVTGFPDGKGRVAGTFTLEVNASSDQVCTGQQVRIQYFDMTLTNLTSGHVYLLDDLVLMYP
jgi:hypothetical protein